MPIAAASTTGGWATAAASTSAGPTRLPAILSVSSLRPRRYQKPSSSISAQSPWTHRPGHAPPVRVEVALLVAAPQKPRVMPGHGVRIDELADLAAQRFARRRRRRPRPSPGTGPLNDVGRIGRRTSSRRSRRRPPCRRSSSRSAAGRRRPPGNTTATGPGSRARRWNRGPAGMSGRASAPAPRRGRSSARTSVGLTPEVRDPMPLHDRPDPVRARDSRGRPRRRRAGRR